MGREARTGTDQVQLPHLLTALLLILHPLVSILDTQAGILRLKTKVPIIADFPPDFARAVNKTAAQRESQALRERRWEVQADTDRPLAHTSKMKPLPRATQVL